MIFTADSSIEVLRLALEHLLVCSISIGIAASIAVPLGIWVHGNSKLIGIVTMAAGTLYTIPSLALFCVLVPIVGLGMTPTIIGLVLYAQLMLVRAVINSLDSVPNDIRDAARGLGVDRWTIFTQIDLPIALPVFLSNARLAVVTVIGIATIGAMIDGGGLGELILQGISRNQTSRVVVGAIVVTLLAVCIDYLMVYAEKRVRPWVNST